MYRIENESKGKKNHTKPHFRYYGKKEAHNYSQNRRASVNEANTVLIYKMIRLYYYAICHLISEIR